MHGQSRESIKDAVTSFQPSTKCLDMLYEKFGSVQEDVKETNESTTVKEGNVQVMAEHYLKAAVTKHGNDVVGEMVACVLDNDCKLPTVHQLTSDSDSCDSGRKRKNNLPSDPDSSSKRTKKDEEHKEEEKKDEEKKNKPNVPTHVRDVCFIRSGKGVRFCKEKTCTVAFHHDCYTKIYKRGQDLKASHNERSAQNFYGRMHPFKKETCCKLKEFDVEDNRVYFKVGAEDVLQRRGCPQSCTFCGREFVGNTYEVVTEPMELVHENDYDGRAEALSCIERIQAAHENGEMDDYPNGM